MGRVIRRLGGAILLLISAGADAEDLKSVASALEVEQPTERVQAPSFALPNLEGQERRLSRFQGDVVVINFWATWCKPCRDEMPALESLWQAHQEDGLTVIGINVDRQGPRGVRRMAKKMGVSFPVLLDPEGRVRNRYEVQAFPQTYLIARDGKFVGRALGERDWDSEPAHALIEQLLEKSPNE
jgi:peroxiredoxin